MKAEMGSMEWRPAFWRSRIGRQLLIYILTFSSLITIVVTASDLYLEYRAGITTIQDRLNQIERSYAASLGESLWNLDKRQIMLQLRGIAELPDMRSVHIQELTNSVRYAVGADGLQNGDAETRDIAVSCNCDGHPRVIGTLHVEATLTNLYNEIFRRALVILAGQAIQTFLVATFILFVVHQFVTRRLLDLAGAMAGFDLETASPMMLRRRSRAPNEVDDVVDTFNTMSTRLKRHGSEISLANARMASILDNIPDLAWVKDTDGRFIAANRPLATTLGYTDPTQLIGMTDFHVSPAHIAEGYWRSDIEVMRSDACNRTDETHIRADGTTFQIETIKSPLHDAAGNIVGTVGIARDVTERKALEQQLHQSMSEFAASERRYRELVKALPVGVFENEPGKGCVYASDLWSEITGLAPKDVLGDGWVKAVHPDDVTRVVTAWTQDVQACRFHQSEFRLCHVDGRESWVLVRALPRMDRNGTLSGYIGSMTDISERKQMEVALRASEESFRTLAENLPDMVVRLDCQGRFLYATPQVCRVNGHGEDEIIGKTLSEMSKPGWRDHADRIMTAIQRAVHEGEPNTMEVRWNTLDGEIITDLSHIPEKNEAGEVVSVLGISRNITKQKHAEEELRRTALALKNIIANLPGTVFRIHYPAHGPKRMEYLDGGTSYNSSADMTKMPPEQLQALFHPDDQQALFVDLPKRLRASDDEIVHVFRIMTEDGSYRWRRAWERVVERKGEDFFTEGLTLDITDEMLAKQALEKSEQEFRTLAENSPNMIMRYDRDCRRVYVNPAYERATGISRADALNMLPEVQWIHLHPSVKDYTEQLRKVIHSGLPTETIVSLAHTNGTMVTHAVHLVADRDPGGAITGVLAIGHDITLLKMAERQLQTVIDNLPGRTYRLTVRADGMRQMCFTGGSGLDLPEAALNSEEWLTPDQPPLHVHPDDAARMLTELLDHAATRECRYELKYRIGQGNDHVCWVMSRGKVVKRTTSETIIEGMMIDITQEMVAKQSLVSSELRYRELVDALPVGVFEDELGKGCVYASDMWSRLTGLTHDEILGYGWLKAVHPDDRAKLMTLWTQDVDNQAIHQSEYRLRHVDGHESWVLVRAFPRHNADGSVRGYVGSMTDISERKAYETSLEHINRVLRTIAAGNEALMLESEKISLFAKMCDVLVTFGSYRMAWIGLAEQNDKKSVRPVAQAGIEDGYLESADIRWDDTPQGNNPTGIAIRTGLPQIDNDLANQPTITACQTGAIARGYRSSIALPLKGDGTVIGCLTIYSGETNGFAEEEIAILLDFANNIAFTITAIRERRRREEMERHLQQAQKMEALGLLAGSVAHDFNNLLGAIQGFATFIIEDAQEEGKASYYGQRILLAGKRGKALINQIISSSRQTDIKRETFAIADLLDETTELLAATISTTTQLIVSRETGPMILVGDRDLLGQALFNLCMNAHDALGGAPGKILIHIRPTVPIGKAFAHLARLPTTEGNSGAEVWQGENGLAYAVSGAINASQPYVSLVVSDTGCGMDRATLEQIFTPFFTTKKAGHGTGLGLTAVERAVVAHHGAIIVESQLAQGTTFEIVLPCQDGDDAAPIPAQAAPLSGTAKAGRVLLVDDDLDFGDMLLAALERRGFEVSPCADPLEALAGIRDFPNAWDALVTDQMMPNMSGLDLIRSAKAIDPNLICILCTGYAEDILDEATLTAAGAIALLRKPISIDQLVAKLAQTIS